MPTPENLPLLEFGCFDPALLRAVITTRDGGVSTGCYASLNLALHVGDDAEAVAVNRERAADAVGVPLGRWVFAQQIGGATVTEVGAADAGRGAVRVDDAIPATDALITRETNLALVIMSADCVPIVLHDPDTGALGMVHAGWQGTAANVTGACVAAMRGLGADPARIVAGIGPAVDGKLYRVGDDVADAMRGVFGSQARAVLGPDGSGKYLLDLVAAAQLQLTAAGLAPRNINWCGHTTGPSTPFYSHRLEAAPDSPTGRFATIAHKAGS